MEAEKKPVKNVHQGHNVRRIRAALGVKQEALARDLNLTQQAVSLIEQKRRIEPEMLHKIAKCLKIDPALIEELEEDPVSVLIENNNFESGSIGNIAQEQVGFDVDQTDFNNTYHPADKIIELCNEKAALYERIVQIEKEKATYLEELLKKKE